ncbi:hypothetical protein N0B31_18895 [Salinirubellus salinus]|jgi:hypothetical protein|uniref:Uncharacterized protein n=1 Tax=Salinirubellus salinus TaxID=1364945 RepID=A0A9E7R278_9EURY|nr:hypothetical protein [Salinirubellus salinus]UWM54172.1 hypothetical protein N0B31_18895 [Salinirubellus salinus]
MANEWVLAVVLALGGVGSAGIVGLALVALVQRRSVPYLLVTLALVTLGARAVVGAFSLLGMLSIPTHHTAEHLLDVLMAGLVIAAVYTARSARRSAAAADRGYGGGEDD